MAASENLGRRLERQLFAATLDAAARSHFASPSRHWRPEALSPHRYCLLASYRRDGQPVATPLWFAPLAGGFCFRTAAGSAKVARIRRNPEVAIAPCTWRGRPLGSPMAALAFLLEGEAAEAAEVALQQRYGPARSLYTRAIGGETDGIYFEVRPPTACSRPRRATRESPAAPA